jgi:hypothetical protein
MARRFIRNSPGGETRRWTTNDASVDSAPHFTQDELENCLGTSTYASWLPRVEAR